MPFIIASGGIYLSLFTLTEWGRLREYDVDVWRGMTVWMCRSVRVVASCWRRVSMFVCADLEAEHRSSWRWAAPGIQQETGDGHPDPHHDSGKSHSRSPESCDCFTWGQKSLDVCRRECFAEWTTSMGEGLNCINMAEHVPKFDNVFHDHYQIWSKALPHVSTTEQC